MSTLPYSSTQNQSSFGATTIAVGPQPDTSPTNIDPALVQQTKNEIRQIVQEITQLAQTDIPREQFYEEFLRRVVSALAADGGAIWAAAEDGGLNLDYQIQFPARALNENPADQLRHARLVRNVFLSGQPTLVPPQSGSSADDEAGNPTEYLLILAALKVEQETIGVLEILQRAGGGPTTQRGYLRFVVQMSELAGEYLKNRRLRHLADRQSLWDALERFLSVVHRGLDVNATAYTIVNESRSLIQCDRVSLALRSGSQFTIRAVSGLDSIDRRAAEAKLLSQLATVVVATKQPFWYIGEARDLPPQIEKPLHDYLDQSHARLVALLPLFPEADESADKQPSGKNDRKGIPLGVLIVEKLADSRTGDGFTERVNTVARHSATALANTLEHSNLFLLPLWKALGNATWVVRARTLPKTLAVVAALIAALMALVLVPAGFDLSAKGKLQPSIRRDVFAHIDGVVVDVAVRHEQTVTANQVLAKLTNSELEFEIANLLGRKHSTQERINSAQRSQLADRRMTTAERNRLDGELLELRQVADSIDRELELQAQKRELLQVRSDMDGQIVTWNVRDLLLRRPVDQGQVLMTIVDPAGPWELELYMPERRMGHVSQATRESAEGLTVTFMLASHPGREFSGRVVEVHRHAEVHGDEGNSVLLRVAIDKESLPELRSDTTVTAKVHCGQRAIGYVWFHEVLETLQTKVMFWL